jgi:hypothetical protein
MMRKVWLLVGTLLLAAHAAAADFGSPGGPVPANVDEIAAVLREDPYDLELLISFGTSKGGSAGHLALAIRDRALGDDLVYSANFYADREPEHARDFYTDDLMVRIPKGEYLFGTASSVSDKASRMEPRAARASRRNACGSAGTCSACNTLPRCSSTVSGAIGRRLNCRQRESTVTGTFCGSVVARTNLRYSGGSSSVFNMALKAVFDSMWTSSSMKTLKRPCTGL